tara:strand:+ start:543 stop:1292 length:750 start_codon:yes stop_codon:yes gene_type:complete
MAQQNIGVGSSPNDGNGDTLRDAFIKVNDNFTELYTDDTGDVGSIIAGTGISVDSATGDVTGGAALTIADNAVVTDKIADDAVTADKLANSINTEIAANTAKVTNATHTGDVTGATALTIANNVIDFSKLSNVFIAETSITTLTGTVTFDCSTSSVFKLSGDITGAYTISLDGYSRGQVITIYPIKGNQTLNLAGAGSSTNTFNKLGGVDYNDDGSESNIIQLECVDASATDPIFFYSIATFAASSTDI